MRGFVTVFLKHARSVRFEITADAFYVRALEMKVGEIINENYFINDMKKIGLPRRRLCQRRRQAVSRSLTKGTTKTVENPKSSCGASDV